MIEAVLGAFTAGLLGSLHCAGMCGPLAIAVGASSASSWQFLAGKTATYALLGVAAGTFGAALSRTRAGGWIAVAAGLATIALALWGAARRGGNSTGVLLTHVLRRRGRAAPFLAGSLAGLLPCGLVHAMLAQTVGLSSVAGGMAVMVVFGLGTAPALLAAGWMARNVGARWRALGEPLAAAAVVLMGLASIWRGWAALAARASCH